MFYGAGCNGGVRIREGVAGVVVEVIDDGFGLWLEQFNCQGLKTIMGTIPWSSSHSLVATEAVISVRLLLL